MIPKAFFTQIRPSQYALAAYLAIKFYANDGKSDRMPIPKLAQIVGVSVDSFRRGVAELVKKKALKVRHRRKKTAKGTVMNLPNIYEIVDLKADKQT
jgi:hypothetical protein